MQESAEVVYTDWPMRVQNWKKDLFTGHVIIMGNPRQWSASLSTKNDDFAHPKDRYPMMWSEETKEMLEESEVTGVGSYFGKLPNSWERHLQVKVM